ncbi:hypothetical protein AERO_18710 [Aeromicrobium fastidiosum]|uniref:hypothetical protein n=1 Tax=Aeromicrobium fastidiosum TaxID=52699 RepID=UPI0020237C7B|nr:hypothetical protein [Aeromicrobium fastidiosum]MCL8253416.1 hypothetical protein [Aeromicrobium fastidiosum]
MRQSRGLGDVYKRQVAALPEPPRAPVRVERDGAVAIVTLDRPEVRNAIDVRAATALSLIHI